MRKPLIFAALSLTLAACSQTVVPPSGMLAYGLDTSGKLVTFGLGNASSSATSKAITGLNSGDTLVDLDFNPYNGSLYAFAANGQVYTVDTGTGAATANTTPIGTLAAYKTDFNPVANRVRVFDSAANNFRLSVDPPPGVASPKGTISVDGKLAYAAGDANAAKTPNLMGAAYTNSYYNGGAGSGAAPTGTSLYSVDATTNTLDLHTGTPTFNTLTTVGGLGVTLGSNVGFDISTSGGNGGTNTAYLVNDKTLYTVNLTSGVATQVATLSTSLKALALALSAQ
ncbi:DUF4394 domain-containing protein [Deinococcus sp.]|uniref:DUF4394 domain-containing protein n=1 Tax=Deinococcus sp. TaxID=47478 RepID=UPI003C7E549D